MAVCGGASDWLSITRTFGTKLLCAAGQAGLWLPSSYSSFISPSACSRPPLTNLSSLVWEPTLCSWKLQSFLPSEVQLRPTTPSSRQSHALGWGEGDVHVEGMYSHRVDTCPSQDFHSIQLDVHTWWEPGGEAAESEWWLGGSREATRGPVGQSGSWTTRPRAQRALINQ